MNAPVQDGVSVHVVGVQPWLPWPLSAWRWWTEPVAAERLAALRIGLALLLLIDIFWTYLPNLDVFFLDGGPSGSRIFGWYTQGSRWTWSILRGLSDPLIFTLIFMAWLATTVGMACRWLTRVEPASSRWKLGAWWLAAGVVLVAGTWARAWDGATHAMSFTLAPALLAAMALVNMLVEVVRATWGNGTKVTVWLASLTLAAFAGLLVVGWCLDTQEVDIPALAWILRPWQSDRTLLRVAGGIWALSTLLLVLGWQTRAAAIVTWVMSTSFANLNPNIDNAGDVIRGIILFYLMLCPCGAIWSLDRWRERRRGGEPPASASGEPPASAGGARTLIPPWPLRLLFVQLVFIYFMNGLYKLGGDSWLDGDSLHYVLGDVTLTRFSYAQLPAPMWSIRLSTWTVLIWEAGFPLWVSLPWTRKPALWFGVLFHLGIYATMELGNFVPYVLALYLPLLPWGNFRRRSAQTKQVAT